MIEWNAKKVATFSMGDLSAELDDFGHPVGTAVGVHADQRQRLGAKAGEVYAPLEIVKGTKTTQDHGTLEPTLHYKGGDVDRHEISNAVHVPDSFWRVYLTSHRRGSPKAELRLS